VATTSSAETASCPSGVYRIDATERARVLSGDALPADATVAVLDGQQASSRETFFSEIARELRFPDYFGHNWDAVYDCLTDPSVLSATGTVLMLDGFGMFARNDPAQWATGLTVLREACAFWQPLSSPLIVLLYDPRTVAADVSPLPKHCLPPAN
jgi:hypothetical protein